MIQREEFVRFSAAHALDGDALLRPTEMTVADRDRALVEADLGEPSEEQRAGMTVCGTIIPQGGLRDQSGSVEEGDCLQRSAGAVIVRPIARKVIPSCDRRAARVSISRCATRSRRVFFATDLEFRKYSF